MNKLLLNTQIASILEDDGRKIVEFYKEHGFNTISYKGLVYRNEYIDTRFYFYGVNELGIFDNRSESSGLKTITLEEANKLVNEKTVFTIEGLSNGLCALVNNGTLEELREVLNAVEKESGDDYNGASTYYWSQDGYRWNNGSTNVDKLPTQSVTDFLKQININMTTNVSRFPFKLTQINAKRILAIACPAWTDKLAKLWGKDLLLNDYTSITEEFYTEMRNSCTDSQNTLFDEIFGKDVIDNSIDLSKLDMPKNGFLAVRAFGKYKSKGFFLEPHINWEIVTDDENQTVLVPTRK